MDIVITYNNSGTGLSAHCPACGKLLRRAAGCNASGLAYAEVAAQEQYETHKLTCPPTVKEPTNE